VDIFDLNTSCDERANIKGGFGTQKKVDFPAKKSYFPAKKSFFPAKNQFHVLTIKSGNGANYYREMLSPLSVFI